MLTCVVAYLAAAAAHDAKKAAPLLVLAGAVGGFYGTKFAVQKLRDRGVFSSVSPAQRSPATTPPTSEMGDEMGITKRLLQMALAVAVSVAAVTTFVMLDILPYIHKEVRQGSTFLVSFAYASRVFSFLPDPIDDSLVTSCDVVATPCVLGRDRRVHPHLCHFLRRTKGNCLAAGFLGSQHTGEAVNSDISNAKRQQRSAAFSTERLVVLLAG